MKAIILENIRSLNNVGAIFRTADGAGFDRVVCVGYTPTPPRAEIAKTALGAELSVPWEYFATIEAAIETYRNAGCSIIAMEKNTQSVELLSLPRVQNVALIMGNEIDGVSSLARLSSDVIAHLPMLGIKESLNVAVAAGVGMYHYADLSR